MTPNDLIISIISLGFAFMLLPAILEKNKISLKTTVPTFIGMAILSLNYFDMNLILAGFSCAISCIFWASLIYIGIKPTKKTKKYCCQCEFYDNQYIGIAQCSVKKKSVRFNDPACEDFKEAE